MPASLPALFGVMRLCLEDNQLTSSPYSAWPVDSEHTCTEIIFTATVSSRQASNFGKHEPRDRIHTPGTESMQTLAWCKNDDNETQHVYTIACKSTLSQLLLLCGKPELNMPVAQRWTPAQIVLCIHVQYLASTRMDYSQLFLKHSRGI